MEELNRKKSTYESDKDYKKRIAEFYKLERADLKDHHDIRLYLRPIDLAEIIFRLHFKKQATYYVGSGSSHCTAGSFRSENDLYLLCRYYINPKIKFKFCSELLWNMYDGGDGLLDTHFCNDINRHTYFQRKLTTKEEDVRKWLEERKLNLKVRKE